MIDGKGGTNTFNLTVSGNVGLPAAEIQNVAVFNVKDLAGAATAHDMSNVSGLQKVYVNASTVATELTGLDKVAIGVKDVNAGALTHTFTFKDTAFAQTAALDIELNCTLTVRQAKNPF